MKRFLTGLIMDHIGESLENLFSPWLKKYLGILGWILFGIIILGFWYSGFADYDNYAAKSYRIFYLPLGGVVIAMLLYAVIFSVGWRFVDSTLWLVFSVCVPYLIPVIIMVCIRKRNSKVVYTVVLASGALLFLLFLFLFIFENLLEWPAWAKVGIIIMIVAIGYAATDLFPADPFGAASVLDKYAPLGFGRR